MKPPIIPDHTLIRPIGRGAYGEVWLARNIMGTLRAVKLVWLRQFESDRPFEREFTGIERYEPVSRKADGLVHVLQVGRNDAEGYFYYVMELADNGGEKPGGRSQESEKAPSSGLTPDSCSLTPAYTPRTLGSELKRLGCLPTADCLQLALDVVSGLAQLHRHGLVHRDVKPGNIIYVHGRAKLADIGLVAAGGEARTFVGTEGYIPPEGPGSPAADLYALGVVLYQATTSYSPDRIPDAPAAWFASDAANDVLELHEIILKACEGLRERRYQSAEALQADLSLLQSGQSVRQRRVLERRYARLRLAGVAGATLLVCALAVAWLASYRARVEFQNRVRETRLSEQSRQSLARAEEAEREARRQLYTALLEQARATVRSGELGQRLRALDALRRAAAITNTPELRREAWAALSLPDLKPTGEIATGPEVTLAQLDPAFGRLALGRGSHSVKILDVSSNTLIGTLPASTNLPAFVGLWNFDGRFLAIGRSPNAGMRRADIEIWNVAAARRVLWLHDAPCGALAFHPREDRLLVCPGGKQVAVWDLKDGAELRRFALDRPPAHLRYSPEGRRFVAEFHSEVDDRVSVYDAETARLESSATLSEWVKGLDWHPDGRWMALADIRGQVHLCETETGKIRSLGRHKLEAVTALFSPDGQYLFTGGTEQELMCWDLRLMERVLTLSLSGSHLQFRADGGECAVRTPGGVQRFSFDRPSAMRELDALAIERLYRGAFSPDGRWLAITGRDRLGLWEWASATEPLVQTYVDGPPGPVAFEPELPVPFFAPDSAELCAYWNNGLGYWRFPHATNARLQLERVPINLSRRLYSAMFHSNDLILTGGGGVEFIARTNITAGKGKLHNTGAGFGCFSRRGRWFALRYPLDPMVDLFRAPKLAGGIRFTTDAQVMTLDFNPNEDELAVATVTGLEFHGPPNWECSRRLPMTMDRYAHLLFAPDGRTLWVARDTRSAGLYDALTLELLLPLPTGTVPLALSPDGRHLAVSVETRRVQVWDLTVLRDQFQQLGLNWIREKQPALNVRR
jgi:WD40 repeat protein